MIYAGVDPSFTKTGVCLLDTELKKIKFIAICPEGKNIDYKHTLDRSAFVAVSIIRHLDLNKDSIVILEEPLLSSIKASSLGILSGVVAWSLSFIPSIKALYSIKPTYVAGLNRQLAKRLGLTKKAASQYVASKVLEFLVETKGYDIELYTSIINKDGQPKKRSLSHDEAEAFLLLTALLQNKDFFTIDDMNKLASINIAFKKQISITKIKGE